MQPYTITTTILMSCPLTHFSCCLNGSTAHLLLAATNRAATMLDSSSPSRAETNNQGPRPSTDQPMTDLSQVKLSSGPSSCFLHTLLWGQQCLVVRFHASQGLNIVLPLEDAVSFTLEKPSLERAALFIYKKQSQLAFLFYI